MKSCFSPYQKECDNYVHRSNNHDIYLQQVRTSTLSQFDGTQCDINEIESIPWSFD